MQGAAEGIGESENQRTAHRSAFGMPADQVANARGGAGGADSSSPTGEPESESKSSQLEAHGDMRPSQRAHKTIAHEASPPAARTESLQLATTVDGPAPACDGVHQGTQPTHHSRQPDRSKMASAPQALGQPTDECQDDDQSLRRPAPWVHCILKLGEQPYQ